MFVREYTDGVEIDEVLLVREVETRLKRDGTEYLKVQFADRTGTVAAMIWDAIAELAPVIVRGAALRVIGRHNNHPRYGSQITVRAVRRPSDGSFSFDDLLDGPARDAHQMEDDLRELLATIQNPYLRELLDRIFAPESKVWARYRLAPAAKYYHQPYRHGLLEHCLGVAQAVSAISATFPGLDRDVAISGALLHDIGKIEAYTDDPHSIDLTDAGRLQGEIALGYYRIRRAIEELDGFPPELAQAVLHIILSHHGSFEHGSPVLPCTREATLVHMVDNLGGRLGSFDRLEKELPEGQRWSNFDRAIGSGAYFAGAVRPDEVAREAA
jgi:3'-5' exoribonuclease